VITIDRPVNKPVVNVNTAKPVNSSRGNGEDEPIEGSGLDEKLDQREESEQFEMLKGDLPCLDSKPECIVQLEALAIANSPELRAIDVQIASSSDAVKLAKVQGQGSFKAFGEIRTSLESRLLFEALPTIISGRATSDANQTRNNQANADLAIKLAQLEKTKAEIAIAIKGKVVDAVITFEQIRDESDLQSTIVRREEVRSKLIEISYRLGEGTTTEQIARLNEHDRKKIIAAQLKTRLRSQALRSQRLVKGTEGN